MTSAEGLPNFVQQQQSPRVPARTAGIEIRIESDGQPWRSVVRGAFRVPAEIRADFAPSPLCHCVWLLAIDRASRMRWSGRPGGEALLLAGEEPPSGAVDGWFNVILDECVKVPHDYHGTLDVTAILGPLKSTPVEHVFP